MIRIDSRALLAALDAARVRRELSWQELSREIGVSATTMRRLANGGRLEVDVMLAMVNWLGRTVESFTKRTAQ